MNYLVESPSPTVFRPMVTEDLQPVLEIEERCYDFPWTIGVHRDCLRVGYSCWVLDLPNRLGGYGVMSVAVGEAHLLNLCIDLPIRQQGWATRFLDHLMQIARERHAEVMLLEVRPSNQAALRLYEQAGFSEVGFRRGYYPARNGREDAIILARDLLLPAHRSDGPQPGDIEATEDFRARE
jgi:[ribosomal protein S18]-alanine N-acetyltransferase